jgi:hypothetical protein
MPAVLIAGRNGWTKIILQRFPRCGPSATTVLVLMHHLALNQQHYVCWMHRAAFGAVLRRGMPRRTRTGQMLLKARMGNPRLQT